jgi:hypothetical protein
MGSPVDESFVKPYSSIAFPEPKQQKAVQIGFKNHEFLKTTPQFADAGSGNLRKAIAFAVISTR